MQVKFAVRFEVLKVVLLNIEVSLHVTLYHWQVGSHVHNVFNAFVYRIKRALQSFETMGSTCPATHYHVPEDLNL
jgi:hypothetical protein